MKKTVICSVIAAAFTALGYEIGKTEGNNFKEKTVAWGLGMYAKVKEFAGKILPKKCEAQPDQADEE